MDIIVILVLIYLYIIIMYQIIWCIVIIICMCVIGLREWKRIRITNSLHNTIGSSQGAFNVNREDDYKSYREDEIQQWRLNHNRKDKHLLVNAISHNSIDKIFINREVLSNLNHSFTHQLPLISNITNQRRSGRCWIFSFLNLLKQPLIEKYKLRKDFELSENFFFFYDKLEKSRYFLYLVFQTRQLDIEDREVEYIYKNAVSDGGTWNMLVNIIEKYGCIPKTNMRDTYHSGNSRELNRVLRHHLKTLAFELRKRPPNQSWRDFETQYIPGIYELLVSFLGMPPHRFDWEYYQKKPEKLNQPQKTIIYDLTPLSFCKKYIDFQPFNWVVCGHFPIDKYPYYQRYNIELCNNMIQGVDTDIFNIPMNDILDITQRTIDKGKAVWFACDFGKDRSKDFSLLDNKLYPLPNFTDQPLPQLNKGDKLLHRIITPNHAMLIRGYNLRTRGIDKWLVENSHGENKDVGKERDKNNQANGYLTMTTGWFRENVVQVVVPKRVLSPSLLKKYKKASKRKLPPWGGMSCQLLD